jgi:hypothetical protein
MNRLVAVLLMAAWTVSAAPDEQEMGFGVRLEGPSPCVKVHAGERLGRERSPHVRGYTALRRPVLGLP